MPLRTLILAGATISVLVASVAAAAPCPSTVTFEGVTSADIGYSGIGHRVDTGALEIPLAVSNCAGTESGSCGICDVSGPLVSADGRNRRCRGDLAVQCVVDGDCGSAGPCRTYAGPPGPVEAGGWEVCIVSEVTGPVTGTVEPDAGSLTISLPLEMRAIERHGIPIIAFPPIPYWNPSYRPCPTCEAGTCQGGARDGLPCQVDAVNPTYGATSFDCPSSQGIYEKFIAGVVPLSTGTQTITLTPESPRCKGGDPTTKCFCDTCNNADATPCMSNADCLAVGATICGGKRCTSSGMACSTHSECGAGNYCVYEGEATRPDACGAEGCLPSGECADGPYQQLCAEPEAHRYCSVPYQNETCPLTHSCENFALRPCFYDDGTGVTVSGVASPPVAGVASAAVGALLCSGLPEIPDNTTNLVFGFPSLVRIRSEGTLAFDDAVPAATPTPQGTGTPTPTHTPTPIPGNCPVAPNVSCRAATAHGATLDIRRAGDVAKRALTWKWRKGAATTLADFGNPLTTDPYDLCVYHQGQLVTAASVAPGGTCAGRACWKASTNRWKLRNRDTATHAATRIDLKAGAAGKSSIAFAAAGPHLVLPDLATLSGAIEVQLQRGASGVCWGATFDPPFALLDAGKGALKARN